MPVLEKHSVVTALPPVKAGARIVLLDTLRGAAIIGMIIYHFCYNLDQVFGVQLPWFYSFPANVWQFATSGLFLLLTGICTHFAGKPVRRAGRVGGAALLISLITYLFMPQQIIVFGILHCMACCLLCYAGGRRFLAKISPVWGLAVSLALFAVTFHLPDGYLLFSPFRVALPGAWYQSYWLSVLGLFSPDFLSSDYFPLLPNLFLFLAGHYLGYWLPKLPARAAGFSLRPLSFLGRHSLIIYLLHQPLLFGVMQLFWR